MTLLRAVIMAFACAVPSVASAQSGRDLPEIEAVIAAALRSARAPPSDVRDAMSRARSRAWLPSVRFGAQRRQSNDRALLNANDGTLRFGSGDDLMIEGSLVFDLPSLVFAPEEPRLLREEAQRVEEQRALVREVVRVYFAYRRARLDASSLDARGTPEGRADAVLRAEESAATLDAFTNGEFRRMMRPEPP